MTSGPAAVEAVETEGTKLLLLGLLHPESLTKTKQAEQHGAIG